MEPIELSLSVNKKCLKRYGTYMYFTCITYFNAYIVSANTFNVVSIIVILLTSFVI